MDKKELIKLILFVVMIFAIFFIGLEIKRLVDTLQGIDFRLQHINNSISNG
ncbi:hypothetical protein [Neobacillus soli]|uniref:hypothetical protein n=1 Tax=Neobacillus soli TaxID=220688 RepID=UPI000AF4159E|nr:hypothetical protein [Neobacillus soli]